MSLGAAKIERPVKYRFEPFELSRTQGALWRDGVRIPLMPKPLATLLVLVDRAGQTIPKDDLLAEVWNGAAVEENNLTQCISALRKVLGEKRGENRFIVTEPGEGYRFVAPVTRIDEAMQNYSVSAASSNRREPVLPSTPAGRLKLFAAVAAVLVLALVAGVRLSRRPSGGVAQERKSVAILGIRNLSKGSAEAWLETALPEMLTSELANGGKLRALPAEDVARWRSGTGASAGNAELIRMARSNFRADSFILGSYVVLGACPQCQVRVDLGLFDARNGERVSALIDEGSVQDLLDLTARLGTKLRAELGVGGTSPPVASWPAPGAMREYSEGLNALRQGDPIGAKAHLEEAVSADPSNALIHSALADAWSALGYGVRAIDENRRAYELSASLSRLDKLGIEARYRSSAQQWDQAIEIYQEIFRLFPDSLEDGLNLARAQFRGMKGPAASVTLQALRRLPPPAGTDPRIDLLEAQNAGVSSDFAKTRDYARRAAEEAKSRGARYLFARARLLQGGAMQNMNDAGYYAVQTEARKVCEELGDRQCVAHAWRIHANDRFYAGEFQEAQEAYLKGATVARELGDRAELANLLDGLAVVSESNLDWHQAEQDLLEAISLKKETGYDSSGVYMQLAQLYMRLGRFSEAEHTVDFAESEAQKANAQQELGEVAALRAKLARSQGRLDAAERLDEQAIVKLRAANASFALALALTDLSSILTARGELGNAEKRLAEAKLEVVPEVRARGALARAELLLAQGQFERSNQEAKQAVVEFESLHLEEDAATALVAEANALEMLGRYSDALAVSQQAEQKTARTLDPVAASLARLAHWRLSGDADSTLPADLRVNIAKLQNPEVSIIEDFDGALRARRVGIVNAKQQLEKVSSEADAHGYHTIAKWARVLGQ